MRLIGPRPKWARKDGGEAGLHPSNLHDNAYAIGAMDFTGDMPILLGPDGPSLGGFVCPASSSYADLWKMGQFGRATRSDSSVSNARPRPRALLDEPRIASENALTRTQPRCAERPASSQTTPSIAPPAIGTC